jgi:hypothetical protein
VQSRDRADALISREANSSRQRLTTYNRAGGSPMSAEESAGLHGGPVATRTVQRSVGS